MNYQLILGKIKDGQITLEEITKMNLNSKTRAILLYAYYEVNKMNYNLKQLLNQAFWSDDEEMLLIKKKLVERGKQNSKFFDIGYFYNLIANGVKSRREVTIDAISDNGFLDELPKFQKHVNSLASQNLEAALELCEASPYANNKNVIAQRMRLLKALGRYEEAKTLSDEYGILDNSQYKEPLKDSNQEPISVNDIIKIIIGLRYAGKFEEALDLCENGPYADNINVLVQRVGLLKEFGRLDEALDICEQPNLAYKQPIIHARIKILRMLERREEALALCEMPKWRNNMTIVVQRVHILIALNRLEEALEITQKSRYENVISLNHVVAKVIATKMEIETVMMEVENTTNSLDYDKWISLVGKVNFLISWHAVTNCIGDYLDFLLQVNVRSETKQVVSYVEGVAILRKLRDSLTNRVKKTTNEEPDSSGDSEHKLNLAFKTDLC